MPRFTTGKMAPAIKQVQSMLRFKPGDKLADYPGVKIEDYLKLARRYQGVPEVD